MRRTLFVLLALLALLPSCGRGSGDDDGPASVGGGITVPGEAPTTADDGDGGGDARPAPTASSDTVAGGSSPRPTADGSPPPATTALDRSWLGPPGSYAARLLRPTPARSVVLEVFEQEGGAPRSESLSHVRSTLAEVSGKQVTLSGPVRVAGGPRAWSADELRSLADEQSGAAHTADRAAVRMLFLRGTFEGNNQVLGVAVRGDVMAVFTDRVAASATVLVPRSTLEKAVTLHEMGHILGLVGLVVNAERQDPDHPGHSRNRGSVMFWAVESSLVGQVLGGPPPTDFDNEDLADLATIRSGG